MGKKIILSPALWGLAIGAILRPDAICWVWMMLGAAIGGLMVLKEKNKK